MAKRLTELEKIERIANKSADKIGRLESRIETKNRKALEDKELKRLKKEMSVKIDGSITPDEIERIRKHLRQAWMWTSIARRICIKRATDSDGFVHCENISCPSGGDKVPKIFVDHIEVMGSPLAPDFITRLWCASKNLQSLCKKCHDKKTKDEKHEIREQIELDAKRLRPFQSIDSV